MDEKKKKNRTKSGLEKIGRALLIVVAIFLPRLGGKK